MISFFAALLAARQTYEMVGRGPNDVDLVEIYKPFIICEIILLEDLGFFPKGEGYRALGAGLAAREGKLPINTSGGRFRRASGLRHRVPDAHLSGAPASR